MTDSKQSSDNSSDGGQGQVKKRPAKTKSKTQTPRKRTKKEEPGKFTFSFYELSFSLVLADHYEISNYVREKKQLILTLKYDKIRK